MGEVCASRCWQDQGDVLPRGCPRRPDAGVRGVSSGVTRTPGAAALREVCCRRGVLVTPTPVCEASAVGSLVPLVLQP